MSLPESARALLALPPDRFVEERNALARSLQAGGDPAAGAVRKLRRPAGLAWVLNRLARERREDVEALIRAGDRLRAGHRRALAGDGPAELREAEEELRVRARALRPEARRVLEEAGRRADPGVLARLELLLRVVAPAPGPEREAFRSGALEAEPSAAAGELGGLAAVAGSAPAAGATSSPRAAAGGAGPKAARKGDRAARSEAEQEARRARRAEVEAERRRRAARRVAARAAQNARRADAAASRAEEAARRAAERARDLRARADAARAELVRRQEALGATPEKR
jgi:hypothetical protein